MVRISMKRVSLSIAAAAAFLAGCQTQPVQQMSYKQLVTLTDQLDARCAAQGAPPGTRNYKACFKQEANREVYTRAANRQRIRAIGNGLAAAGAAAQANQPVQTNCTRTTWGAVNCTSY
jgi:hypothetical protein